MNEDYTICGFIRMDEQIFPKEIIEETVETHLWNHTVRSQVIYSTIMIGISVSLALLPFIHVDVGVKSRGLIRPVVQRQVVTSLVSGKIKRWHVRENSLVREGDLLVEIESAGVDEQLSVNRRRRLRIRDYLFDLEKLRNWKVLDQFDRPPHLKTALYKQEMAKLRREIQNAISDYHERRDVFKRKRQLYNRDVISESEFKQAKYRVESAAHHQRFLVEQMKGDWEAKLVSYRNEMNRLAAEFQQLQEKKQLSLIYAPVTGTIQDVAGKSVGALVRANEKLANISPDTGLVAECLIVPRDIGLLKEGMRARFQFDAYDYHEWGVVEGWVQEISEDISMTDNRPAYKVRCLLEQESLKLKSGYRGKIKKGMTFRVRFKVARRSLFQLLYERMDDWLNPRWNKGDETV